MTGVAPASWVVAMAFGVSLTLAEAPAYSQVMAKRSSGATVAAPSGDRVVTQNRRAYHDYFIDETVEAGLALTGSEIKSIREGKVTIGEAYVRVNNGELWLIGANVTPYSHGAYANHDPGRPRKLLVHRRQIEELQEATERKGMTLVPLRIRLRNGRAKIDVGVARGKKLYDKRQAVAERDAKRSIERAMRERSRE
jgi:SsrA-binding protein